MIKKDLLCFALKFLYIQRVECSLRISGLL